MARPNNYLSIPAAAKRVKKSKRTIEAWIHEGRNSKRLPAVYFLDVPYVDEKVLLAFAEMPDMADDPGGDSSPAKK
ncbi:hypothetical protein [Glaciihabitans sp. dw_435]|uniref:hypothetical protein n=1 Tax=Glaciihabitans sp. dw_435 TaxID=2720081 RepID=UPI001BD6ADB6|nr:hypothetical protein [Glaciihabitans sp. dw_435]